MPHKLLRIDSIVTVFACALLALFTLTSVSFASNNPSTIVLTEKLTPLQLKTIQKKHNLKITELHFAQGEIQGGYTVQPGESVDAAIDSLAKLHKEFLEVSLDEVITKSVSSDQNESDRFAVLREQLETAEQMTNEGNILIDELTTSDTASIEKLGKLGYVKELRTLEKEKSGITLESTSHESWAPYGGTSDIKTTYTRQTFYFNKISDFGSTNTYEHETQVYDKKFANYAGYWSSNMPKAYYDTPFLDTIDNFTVGTLTANALKINTQYYTYMSLKAGTVSSATVRIKGQKGHRTPSSCYSTWCVFADATTGTMALLTAPSGKSWQY